MRVRILSYLSVLTAVAVCLVTQSCSRRSRAIPRDDLAEIYAEMFLLDEQLYGQPRMRHMADTSKVYEAVFEKYGYTADNYRASQEKYIQDAGRYVRILKKSVAILEDRNKLLKKEKALKDDLLNAVLRAHRFAPRIIYMPDTMKVGAFTLDSISAFDFQKGLDTAFYGPEMVVWADTIGIRDSLARRDSLVRADSLARVDSLVKAELLENFKFRNGSK